MKFSKIDIDTWERKEYFNHYYNNVRCTYSLTVNIDITKLYHCVKDRDLRVYPVLIWLIANAVNHFEFLRFNYDEDGNVGFYDEVNPSFTYKFPDNKRFNVLWCKYNQELRAFYDDCICVMNKCDGSKMFPMQDMPKNCFDISALPWIEFTSFNLNVYADGTHLAPIFTTGKLIKDSEKIKLPLSIQVHHAVCDGYDVSCFISYLQDLANKIDDRIS